MQGTTPNVATSGRWMTAPGTVLLATLALVAEASSLDIVLVLERTDWPARSEWP